MTFTNPRKVTVLTEHLDFYQWPCIPGESFPPTFAAGGGSGTVAYSSITTYPTVGVAQSFTIPITSSAASWPALPLSSPRTGVFNGYTVTLKFYIVTLQVNNAEFQIFLDPFAQNGIMFNKTQPNGITTLIGNGSGSGSGACPSLQAWHDLAITVAADGLSIAYTLDGALICLDTSGVSIATYAPALTVIAKNGGSFAVDGHVTQIKHSWS